MTEREMVVAPAGEFGQRKWSLRMRQVWILLQSEVRRNLFTRRRFWVYLLAFGPVALLAVRRAMPHPGAIDSASLQDATRMLAAMMQFYYVRLGLFFACMGIFTWLFRGEMVERTLHYPFLLPVRREVLVVGKFLAGAAITIALFEMAVLGCFFLLYSWFGSLGWHYVFEGGGLHQLGAYMLIVALGGLGYGSVFLGLSLVFRNPIVPGAVFFGWEAITPVLPSWLQPFSVTFYLKPLYPISVSSHLPGILALFTVVTEPVSTLTAIVGLLCFTAVVLAFSCYRIRKTEIAYTSD